MSDDYIVMVVAGPNARKDYHYNETEELFYQLEGTIKVIIQEDGQRKEMELTAGDMYLHPAQTPHSPVRSEGSIGLVIERVRAGRGFTDGLLWFCDNCNHKLHEVYFEHILHRIEQPACCNVIFKAFSSQHFFDAVVVGTVVKIAHSHDFRLRVFTEKRINNLPV